MKNIRLVKVRKSAETNRTPQDMFFAALGNENRLRILRTLTQRPMQVNELSERLGMEQSCTSHHLKSLLDCRFVDVKVKGRGRTYMVSPGIKELINALNKYIHSYSSYLSKCGPES